MAMTRLDSLSTELVNRLRCASVKQQHAASLAACEFAITHAKIEDPLVLQVLAKVRASIAVTTEEKGAIDALVEKLDEEYFNLQESSVIDQSSTDDYLKAFGKARAVAALLFAGNPNPFEAATEAIYEAAVSTDDKEGLFSFIRSLLE